MKQKIIKLQFESPLMLEKIYKEADESIGNMLEFIKRQYKLSWTGLEFDSIVDAYNKMKVMKI